MAGKRLILWDFHGTLSYQIGGWTGTIADALRELDPSLNVAADDVRPLVQTGFPWQAPERDYRHNRDPERWWRSLEPVFARVVEGLGARNVGALDLLSLVRARYTDPSVHSLFSDALPTMRELACLGWSHAVLSNHVPELPEIAIGLGLSPLVQQVITSAVVGFEKPHSGIYRFAFGALDVDPAIDDVWMVGDNYEADVLGAEMMGARAILVRKEHLEAMFVAPDLGGVVPIVLTAKV